MSKSDNTKGRAANAAQPLGEREGTSSKSATQKVGKDSLKKAGPDGGDSGAVARTFKRP
jgi:hypothetical protein